MYTFSLMALGALVGVVGILVSEKLLAARKARASLVPVRISARREQPPRRY